MPLGLVEYIAQFFAADNLQQVSCPTDYRQWLQTMYAHFGQKWIELHRGPMWCTVMSTQEASTSASRTQKTMEALVNVPAVAERSLRYDFASSEITLDAQIQLNVLDEAAKSNPGAWWWLKADGCNINKGLKETTKLQWSGDVDLGDGALQKQYQSYKLRLQKVNELSASAADGLRAVYLQN
ncbi:uncharacterized protein [Dysidea avara]|uniref:uncharacterized protein n=1 Tax=Dysidea avara TaxID=196820 RepID=UPI003325B05C